MRRTFVLGLFTVCAGCGRGKGPTTGTTTESYKVSPDVRTNPNLTDTLVGAVYGSIYFSIDVGAAGPTPGINSVVDVAVQDIDLIASAVSATTWTSTPMEPGDYTFLGLFDVKYKGTQGTQSSPVPGDPVTLPTTNQFHINPGEDTQVTILFDLLYQ